MSVKKKKGFTLIELLVVITIIGLLAGLAVPAISGALNKAKQAADTANVRQLGIIFFGIANDEGGRYPVAPFGEAATRPTSPVATTVDLFEGMIADGDLKDPKVLATNGTVAYKGSLSAPSMDETHVGWDYLTGLTTTSSSQIPLFLTAGAIGSPGALEASGESTTISLEAGNLWGDEGMVVYYVGNSAEWIKARNGNIPAPIQDTGVISAEPNTVTLMPRSSSGGGGG